MNHFAILTHKLSGQSLTHKRSDQDKEIVKPQQTLNWPNLYNYPGGFRLFFPLPFACQIALQAKAVGNTFARIIVVKTTRLKFAFTNSPAELSRFRPLNGSSATLVRKSAITTSRKDQCGSRRGLRKRG
jgi:hypothetical protein